jgi:hypothetical protein
MRKCDGLVALRRLFAACLLLWLAGLGCEGPPQHGSIARKNALDTTATEAPEGPARDLSQDEAAGGHTLRKHVGRTEEELRERLRHERHLSAASTWTDRKTAERAVGFALNQNRDQIDSWSNRSGGHPNLVIDYDGDPARPIGQSLRRDADHAQPCAYATIVLRWTAPSEYYVLTSYPECR